MPCSLCSDQIADQAIFRDPIRLSGPCGEDLAVVDHLVNLMIVAPEDFRDLLNRQHVGVFGQHEPEGTVYLFHSAVSFPWSGFLYSIVGGGRLAFQRLHFAHTLFLVVLHRPPCVAPARSAARGIEIAECPILHQSSQAPDRPLKLMAHGVRRNALRCGDLLKGPVFLGAQKQSPPLVVRQRPQRVFQRRIGLLSDQHGLRRLALLDRVGVHVVRVCKGIAGLMLKLPVIIPIGLLLVLVQILRGLRRFGDALVHGTLILCVHPLTSSFSHSHLQYQCMNGEAARTGRKVFSFQMTCVMRIALLACWCSRPWHPSFQCLRRRKRTPRKRICSAGRRCAAVLPVLYRLTLSF